MKTSKMFICEDCIFIFQTHSAIKARQPYCPKCGENLEVRRYKAELHSKQGKKIKVKWTQPELELLNQCLDGELQPHQVAIMTGRTIHSVKNKLRRI